MNVELNALAPERPVASAVFAHNHPNVRQVAPRAEAGPNPEFIIQNSTLTHVSHPLPRRRLRRHLLRGDDGPGLLHRRLGARPRAPAPGAGAGDRLGPGPLRRHRRDPGRQALLPASSSGPRRRPIPGGRSPPARGWCGTAASSRRPRSSSGELRRRRLPIPVFADAVAPALALAYGVGRIGCFLVGDDYGRPTSCPGRWRFPQGAPPSTAAQPERALRRRGAPGVSSRARCCACTPRSSTRWRWRS